MTIFQVPAGFDVNSDLNSSVGGWSPFDYIVPIDTSNYAVPTNGPITTAAPWALQWQLIPSGNIGGSYSAGSVWSGVQVFTTPDAMWTRKADRVYSNGAVTVTPWLKVLDFNCPGVTY